ncbi:MAG: hypothetical protein K2X48_19240 [Chitinophagaceae bacterium]|nr:hypothetical protein [Chitinophagaceae bacterium]
MRFINTNCAEKSTHQSLSKFSLKFLSQLFLFFTTVIILYSCKKNDLQSKQPQPESVSITSKDDIQKILDSEFFVQNRKVADMAEERNNDARVEPLSTNGGGSNPSEYPDEVPMILGGQLPNPYSIPVMTEAYNTYYASNLVTVPVTDLYVKFSPVNESQLALLEDSMDLDLYDYPLDYEVITDGDYYQQPGKGAEDMPEFYTTVPVGFQFPVGIPYAILEQLHFPHNDIILEALAESIAAGGHYTSLHPNSGNPEVLMTRVENGSQLTNLNECFCDPTPQQLQCIPPDPNCGGGDPGGGGPGGPGSGNPTPPFAQPSGGIQIHDTQLGNQPLQYVRVIAKRGLRRSTTYTDASGHFASPIFFTGRTKVKLKFRNPSVSIRPLRNVFRIRLSLKVLSQNLGRYNFPLNTINHTIQKHPNKETKEFEYWLAGHAIHSYNYFAQQSPVDDVKRMTGHRLFIYLQKKSDENNRGPEADLTMQNYIFKKRGPGDWLFEAGKMTLYLVKQNYVGAGLQFIENVLSFAKPDIVYKYNTLDENLSSNEINQQYYAAYAKAGTFKSISDNDDNLNKNRWKFYFKAKDKWLDAGAGLLGVVIKNGLYELKALKFLYQGDQWYVPKTGKMITWSSAINISATVLAGVYYSVAKPDKEFYNMVDGFGEYYGHFLANRRYGSNADPILDQQRKRVISSGGLSSHRIYLENWNPNEGMDELIDYKVGLFYDLDDLNATPLEFIPNTTITDQVQSIKASSSQKSVSGYAPRLIHSPEEWHHLKWNLQMREPSQTAFLNNLFTAYNAN